MVRAAAKNHANVAIVTSPAPLRRRSSRRSTRRAASTTALRRALALEAFAHTAAYDARIAAELPGADGRRRPALPTSRLPGRPYPTRRLTSRSRRSRRSATARTRTSPPPATGGRGRRSPTACSAMERAPLQGKALSYNNVLDAAAAAALGRALRGPGVVIVKHTNPCGAAERPIAARRVGRRRSRRTRSARSAGSWRSRDRWTAPSPSGSSRSSSRSSSPRRSTPEALEVLATKPNLRVLVDEASPSDEPVPPTRHRRPGRIRTGRRRRPRHRAGHRRATTPATWTCATRRAPTDAEQLDLDLAWRLVRGVTSNAIVLVRDRRLVGMGSGQTSRVDAARQAVAKAHAMLGPDATVGAACASRRVLPVPRRHRGVPRRRRRRRSPSPAARCATPRRSRSSTRPAPRC